MNLSGIPDNNPFFFPCSPVLALDWLYPGKGKMLLSLNESTHTFSELLIL